MMSRIALVTLATLLPLVGGAQAGSDPLPDLVVSSAWILDASGQPVQAATAGEEVILHGLVANVGPGNADDFVVRFLADGALYAQARVPGLESGASMVVRAAARTATVGEHEFRVDADSRRSVFERDEMNNGRKLSVLVENRALVLEADATARETQPFGEVVYELRVHNLDDERTEVRLSTTRAGFGWRHELVPERLELAPGAQGVVRLTVNAQPGGAPEEIRVEAFKIDAPAVASSVSTRTLLAP